MGSDFRNRTRSQDALAGQRGDRVQGQRSHTLPPAQNAGGANYYAVACRVGQNPPTQVHSRTWAARSRPRLMYEGRGPRPD